MISAWTVMSSGKFMINDIHAPATARETKWTFQDHGVNTTLWVYNNASKQNYLLLQGPQKKIFLHNYDYDEVWVPVRCVKNY